ncbi:MAG: S8 family serine peptidase, partial [Bacillota bacterium]
MRLRHWFRWMVAAALILGAALPPGTAAAEAGAGDRLQPVPVSGPVEANITPPSLGQHRVEVLVKLRHDPLARVYARSLRQGRALSALELKEHRAKLEEAQNKVLGQVAALGGREIFRFKNALNAVQVQVPVTALPKLAEHPDVAGIYPARPVTLNNETSVPFIGADKVWDLVDREEVPVRGEGVRVAVIDTGIDYYHAALGGSGNPDDYRNDNPTVLEPGTFPNAKVVGGYDLVGDDYDAGSDDPERRIPRPDPDPLDANGHGTHVAATIGGVGVPGKIGPGVAPGVQLYAYKVFGREGSTTMTTAAIEMAMDPNGDGDLSDHVDVINMSLGSPFGEEIEAEVAQAAAELGIIVVASAGNNGNVPYITGSPAVAPGAISVAASVDNGIVRGAIKATFPDGTETLFEAIEAAFTPPLAETRDVTGTLVDTGGLGCSPEDFRNDPAGAIALIDRGVCPFVDKVRNAQEKGALAVVVVNSVDGDPITMGGDPGGFEIPAVMIARAAGQALRQAMAGGQTVQVTLSAQFSVARPDLADTLADFTSRGPGGARSSFKPDLAAPGFDIRSAAVGTGTEGVLMSGTSMAAPHVAGAAALLRQLHPDWSVEEIKAVLQNTATPARDRNGNAYPLTLQGTGRIQVDKAARATVVALPGGVSFGYVPVPAPTSVTRTVTVRNKSGSARTFALDVAFNGNSYGTQAQLSRSEVTVPAWGEAAFDLTLTFDPAHLPLQWSEPFVEVGGWIRLTERGSEGEELVVGFTAFPEATAQVKGAIRSISEPDEGPAQAELELTNPSPIAGYALPFHFLSADSPDPNLRGYEAVDIRYVGARASWDPDDGDLLEFVVVTAAPWTADETVGKEVHLDVDLDGAPDYALFTYNLRHLGGANAPATFVYDFATGNATAYYYTPLATWYNANVTVLTAPMDAVGLQPGQPFGAVVLTIHESGVAVDTVPPVMVAASVTRTPLPDLPVAQDELEVLQWSDVTDHLLLVYLDNRPTDQHQVFTFSVPAPAPPSNLRARNLDRAVQLFWDRSPSNDTTEYLIYRTDPGAGSPTLIASVPQGEEDQLSYTDSGLQNETEYVYHVYAQSRTGVRSAKPAAVKAHPSAPPAQPKGFSGKASAAVVILSWEENTEPDLGGYIVYWMDPDSGWVELERLPANKKTWVHEGADTSVDNTYGLVAVDEWGVESAMATTTVKRFEPPRSGGGGGGG